MLGRDLLHGKSTAALDFRTLAAMPDERLDVLSGALLIAKDEYPSLDVAAEKARIDAIAAPIGRLDGLDAAEQAEILADRLFGECGFRGNAEDYYDPRNSFLNDVIERKLGIPISLSVLYTEVARRAGVHARGIAFPSHFLVRIDSDVGEPLIVDPFSAGRVVGQTALWSFLPRGSRRGKTVDRSLIAPASPRAILLRMLGNLKGIYGTRGELSRLLVVTSRILELDPRSADDLRDRGLIAMRLGAPRAAEEDLRRYVELLPEAGDIPEVRRILGELNERRPVAN